MKEHITRIGGLVVLLVAAVALGMLGCSGDRTLSPTAPESAPVFSRVDPVPAAPKALVTDFDDIVLVLTGAAARRSSGDDMDGWYGTEFEPTEYPVSELSGALCGLVDATELPDGDYTQVRLTVIEGCRILIGGESFDLVVGGGTTADVKLDLAFTIAGGTGWPADLAIDPTGTVRVTGKGRYRMPPSLPVEAAVAVGGAISGTVLPAEAQAEVWVDTLQGRISTFAAGDSGDFLLANVPPGTYVLNFTPTVAGPWEPAGLGGIVVVEGETTDIGIFVLGGP